MVPSQSMLNFLALAMIFFAVGFGLMLNFNHEETFGSLVFCW
jgi:hypothetical protein